MTSGNPLKRSFVKGTEECNKYFYAFILNTKGRLVIHLSVIATFENIRQY